MKSINHVAIIVAAVVLFAIGAVWYNVFSKPWLEGIGSRNSPVTRFPGYHALREAYVVTDRAVPDIAQPRIDALIDRINNE